VEWHLRQVFSRLGIHSRGELANAPPSCDSQLVPGRNSGVRQRLDDALPETSMEVAVDARSRNHGTRGTTGQGAHQGLRRVRRADQTFSLGGVTKPSSRKESIKRKVLAVAATLTIVAGVITVGAPSASAATPACGDRCISLFSRELGTYAQPNVVEAVLDGWRRWASR
jgi:hypothetical protein